ncbi:MAG: hypothetical protein HY848_18880 [Betaproteobacteria bacterium]|nr:hypothetical protein [Betaproteobacteria bacterium]
MRVIALIDDPGVVRRILWRHAMVPRLFRIRAALTQAALQSAERRRKMLPAQCSAALNRRRTVAIGRTREKRQD